MAGQPRSLVDVLREEAVTVSVDSSPTRPDDQPTGHYTVTVEVAARGVEDRLAAGTELAHVGGTVETSPRGWACATVTVPGPTLGQATTTAIALVTHALRAEPVSCHAMTKDEADARRA
jgi:hypothetical protein